MSWTDPLRLRIGEALVDLVLERGYEGVTLPDLLARADVERADFEQRFTDLHDCYMQLFVRFTGEFDSAVFASFETPGPWRDRLRRAAYAAARWVRDHPRESAFSSTQMFGAGDMAQAHRIRHLEQLVDLIDAGRQEMPDPGAVSRAAAEGVLGSIYAVTTERLGAGSGIDSIEELVPELMYLAVRPYLGHEVAREELTLPPPPER